MTVCVKTKFSFDPQNAAKLLHLIIFTITSEYQSVLVNLSRDLRISCRWHGTSVRMTILLDKITIPLNNINRGPHDVIMFLKITIQLKKHLGGPMIS